MVVLIRPVWSGSALFAKVLKCVSMRLRADERRLFESVLWIRVRNKKVIVLYLTEHMLLILQRTDSRRPFF